MIRIAYQGFPGAFSQLAARQRFPEARTMPMPDFEAVVRAVRTGASEYGILPLTNSIIGAVASAHEAMALGAGLQLLEQVIAPIQHCLLALPGAAIERLRSVDSHPAALAQCARFWSARQLLPHPVDDTAGAARRIAMDRDYTRAAIASVEAAEHYGLTVLLRDIADAPDNRTTFVIFGCERATAAA